MNFCVKFFGVVGVGTRKIVVEFVRSVVVIGTLPHGMMMNQFTLKVSLSISL